ncbi:hypothetical protein [Microcoleus sp.]
MEKQCTTLDATATVTVVISCSHARKVGSSIIGWGDRILAIAMNE